MVDDDVLIDPFDPEVLRAAGLHAYLPRRDHIASPIEPEFVEHAQQAGRVVHALFAHRDSDSVRDGLPTDVSRADMLNAIVLLDSFREVPPRRRREDLADPATEYCRKDGLR